MTFEGLAIELKPSDSRSRAYVDRYGERCWKADILPPGVIGDALDAHIESWLDRRRRDRRHVVRFERINSLSGRRKGRRPRFCNHAQDVGEQIAGMATSAI